MWHDLLAFSKKQTEKSIGSLQSGTVLTLHLEVVLDGTLIMWG